MEREVGTVIITTEEYVRLYLDMDRLKKSSEHYENALRKLIEAVEEFIRSEHGYGRYTYFNEKERELLSMIGDDYLTFDLKGDHVEETEEQKTTEQEKEEQKTDDDDQEK